MNCRRKEVVLMAYEDMAVFIENLGVYNEGGSSGAWFTFPIDENEVPFKHLTTSMKPYRIFQRKSWIS